MQHLKNVQQHQTKCNEENEEMFLSIKQMDRERERERGHEEFEISIIKNTFLKKVGFQNTETNFALGNFVN